MNRNVLAAIQTLDKVHAKDMDECSVSDLTQFYFAVQKHVGAIFVKTVGRMAGACEGRPWLGLDGVASVRHQSDGDMK